MVTLYFFFDSFDPKNFIYHLTTYFKNQTKDYLITNFLKGIFMYKRLLILFICFILFNSFILPLPKIPVRSFTKEDDGVVFKMEPGLLKLQVCTDKIIRVIYTPKDELPQKMDSHALVKVKWCKVDYSVSDKKDEVIVTTDKVQAVVDKASGAVSFYDKSGKPLLQEVSGGGKIFVPKRMKLNILYNFTQKFLSPSDENFYGLGGQWHGDMNYRGQTVELWQNNTTKSNPVIHSNKGYSLLWNNASEGYFRGGPDLEVIPPSQFTTPDGDKNGLKGEYFQNEDFTDLKTTRIDSNINFKWGLNKPVGSINPKAYGVRWTGKLKTLDKEGYYTFYTLSDFRIRLWINGKMVIENWIVHNKCYDNGKIWLKANTKYDIKVKYNANQTGVSIIKLLWIPPQKPTKEVSWNFTLGNAIDYYFIYGPTMDEQNEGYYKITGNTPMMPKWAYGLFHSQALSKNGSIPATQKDIEDLVDGYRSRKIPIDVVVQDFHYFPEGMWGSHLFDTKTHPDPDGMVNYIHKHNMHLMISVTPIFQNQNPNGFRNINYNEMKNSGNLLILYDHNNFSWYNPWKKAARVMYWDQINKYLYSLGIDAWWLDDSEGPNQDLVIHDWWRESTLGETHALQYANEYSLMNSKAVYEGQRKTSPNKRVFILTRCGFAGQQRYSSAVWSGDIGVDFWTLKHQIPEGLNFTLSGIPYWTTDIGGFGGGFAHYKDYNGRDPNDSVYRETFVRWFQFGSFCPIFRIHGATGKTAIYDFGKKAEKILTEYDNLRYRLLPYTYSLAWDQTEHGRNMMRALVMDYENDPKVADITDQFMFGPDLLINPVTKFEARTRELYLPKTFWYDFWTGEKQEGGRTITADAPLEKMPIYVRSGSILPMGPFLQYAMEKPADPIELRIYPGSEGSFNLYEDDGITYNYTKGEYSIIPFKWDDKNKTLIIGKRQGSYPGMLDERTFQIVIVGKNHGTGLEPETKPDKVINYSGNGIKVIMK